MQLEPIRYAYWLVDRIEMTGKTRDCTRVWPMGVKCVRYFHWICRGYISRFGLCLYCRDMQAVILRMSNACRLLQSDMLLFDVSSRNRNLYLHTSLDVDNDLFNNLRRCVKTK